MATHLRRPKIFVSHATEDCALVKALVDCLEDCLELREHDVCCTCVAGHTLAIGANIAQVIRQEVHNALAVIALLTPISLASQWVLIELGVAWGARRQLFPLLVGGLTNVALPGPLHGLTAACVEDETQMAQFVEDLGKTIDAAPRTAPKVQRAIEDFREAARAEVAQPSYARAAQPNGPPLPVLGVRGMLTQYYIEKATHAREIDIITLTMDCVFDFYGYERIREWLREGKRIRILTLAPHAFAAVARGEEEKHPELPAKIRHQVEGPVTRLYDEAWKDPDGRRGFKGSFEIRWHNLIPYFAYFRADDEVAVGLYYTHLRGLCSESLHVPRTSPLFKKMKDHFEGLWGRDDEWVGRLCYIGRDECQLCPLRGRDDQWAGRLYYIGRDERQLCPPPDVNGREE